MLSKASQLSDSQPSGPPQRWMAVSLVSGVCLTLGRAWPHTDHSFLHWEREDTAKL